MARMTRAAGRAASSVFSAIPETWRVAVHPGATGYRRRDIPPPIAPPDGDVRLLIAPANFAGQAYHWARAASRLDGVAAVNLQSRRPDDDFVFSANHEVPLAVFRRSRSWAKRHFAAVTGGFTHVLVEAVRPVFGCLFDGDVETEVRAMRDAGLQVGMIVHGSEVRLPSEHRRQNAWSPFHDEPAEWVEGLERTAEHNRRVLERVAAPVFASTTTLARIVPGSTWLPISIDPQQWPSARQPLVSPKPVVVHIPSSGPMKGTAEIRRAIRPLVEEGLIEYRESAGVPSAEMPALFGDADIVIDAVRMGNYGAAACEAMASGRVTIVHLNRIALEEAELRGVSAPVLESDPIRLEQSLRGVLADPAAAVRLASRGPEFVRSVHDGRRAAHVLSGFLGVGGSALVDRLPAGT